MSSTGIPDVAIYGMGRFGRALAGALLKLDIEPARTGGRAQGPAAFLDGLKPGTLVMLSVRDDAISEVAADFAAQRGGSAFRYIHASGAHGPGLLEPLAEAGAVVGAFHILQSFPPEDGASRIPGSWCALAGPPALLDDLRLLAEALGLHALELPDSARAPYHAAAVLASNVLVTLLAAGRDLLAGAGIAEEDAERMLMPLVQGTLRNIVELGPEKALTGPVARGDSATLRLHMASLPAALRPAYRAMTLETIAFAKKCGRINADQTNSLRRAVQG